MTDLTVILYNKSRVILFKTFTFLKTDNFLFAFIKKRRPNPALNVQAGPATHWLQNL